MHIWLQILLICLYNCTCINVHVHACLYTVVYAKYHSALQLLDNYSSNPRSEIYLDNL